MRPFPFAIWPKNLQKAEMPSDVYGSKNPGQIRLELLRSPLHPTVRSREGNDLPESTFSGLVRCVDTGRIGILAQGIHPYRTTLEKFGGSLDERFIEEEDPAARRIEEEDPAARRTDDGQTFVWNKDNTSNRFSFGSTLRGNSRPLLQYAYYPNQISLGGNLENPFYEPATRMMQSGEYPHFYAPYMRDVMEFYNPKYKTPLSVLEDLRQQGDLKDSTYEELKKRYGKFYEEDRPLTVHWNGSSIILTKRTEKMFEGLIRTQGDEFSGVPMASVFWLDGKGYGPSLQAPEAEPYITGGGFHGGFLTLGVGEGGLSHGDSELEKEDAGEVPRAMSRRGSAVRQLIRQKVLPFVMSASQAPKISIGKLGVGATSNFQFAGLRIAPDLVRHHELEREREIKEAELLAKESEPIPYTPDQFPLWHLNYRRQWPTSAGSQWFYQQGDRHYQASVPSFAPGAMEGDTETISQRHSRFRKEYNRRLREWMDTYQHEDYEGRTFAQILDDERTFRRMSGSVVPRGFASRVRKDFVRHLYQDHSEKFADQLGLPNTTPEKQLDAWMKRSVDYDVPTKFASHEEDLKSPLSKIERILVPRPNTGGKKDTSGPSTTKAFPFAIWPNTLQKAPRIRIISSGFEENPYAPHSTRSGDLSDALESVGLGSFTKEYLQHLDAQAAKLGKSQPLFIISPEIYDSLRKHAQLAHIARTVPRSKEEFMGGSHFQGSNGLPYGYDERAASLAGHAFLTREGHTILIPKHVLFSEDPHEGGNSQAIPIHKILREDSTRTGLVPLATMHAHPPSTLGSHISPGDVGAFGMHPVPIHMIMYPYDREETQPPAAGFTANVVRNGIPFLTGDLSAVRKSNLGSRSTVGFYHNPDIESVVSDRGNPDIITLNEKNVVIPDGSGGYVPNRELVGRGIHAPRSLDDDGYTIYSPNGTVRYID